MSGSIGIDVLFRMRIDGTPTFSRSWRKLLAASLALGMCACSEQRVTGPTPAAPAAVPASSPVPPSTPPPSTPLSPIPPPSTAPALRPDSTLTGQVRLHTADGIRPAPGALPGSLFAWFETTRGGYAAGPIAIDSQGRYEVRVPGNTIRVRMNTLRYSPCAITVDPERDLSADIDIVTDTAQLGANLPASLMTRGPTLSGTVYEQTSSGRRPIPNAWVTLDALDGLGLPIADTLTDANGRYVFCAVPHLPGLSLVGLADGFPLFGRYDILGKTTVDIELTR